jgi:MoaA/NifB/PqqE/SkfB family radical SAM enzyme
VILVTNGVLLNESNYMQLRAAWVNQFSASLDFPDERHDEFRRRPGLYKRLERSLPWLAKLGFRDMAQKLVIKTVLGSTRTVEKTGKHPDDLRNMVTSPGGTTNEALLHLEKGRFRSLILEAVTAACKKAERL